MDVRAAARALDEIERARPRLSPDETAQAAAIKDRASAAEWRAAHIALRVLLERAVGDAWRAVPFTRTAHGKPRLERAPVAFSLAHAPGVALIGIAAGGEIGIDLEATRTVHMAAARRAPIEAAAAALSADEPLPETETARFLQAWVRLEAWAKADGCGIGRLLTRLSILGDHGNLSCAAAHARAIAVQAEKPRMGLRDLALGEGLFAAVAVQPAGPLPAVRRLPASTSGLAALLA